MLTTTKVTTDTAGPSSVTDTEAVHKAIEVSCGQHLKLLDLIAKNLKNHSTSAESALRNSGLFKLLSGKECLQDELGELQTRKPEFKELDETETERARAVVQYRKAHDFFSSNSAFNEVENALNELFIFSEFDELEAELFKFLQQKGKLRSGHDNCSFSVVEKIWSQEKNGDDPNKSLVKWMQEALKNRQGQAKTIDELLKESSDLNKIKELFFIFHYRLQVIYKKHFEKKSPHEKLTSYSLTLDDFAKFLEKTKNKAVAEVYLKLAKAFGAKVDKTPDFIKKEPVDQQYQEIEATLKKIRKEADTRAAQGTYALYPTEALLLSFEVTQSALVEIEAAQKLEEVQTSGRGRANLILTALKKQKNELEGKQKQILIALQARELCLSIHGHADPIFQAVVKQRKILGDTAEQAKSNAIALLGTERDVFELDSKAGIISSFKSDFGNSEHAANLKVLEAFVNRFKLDVIPRRNAQKSSAQVCKAVFERFPPAWNSSSSNASLNDLFNYLQKPLVSVPELERNADLLERSQHSFLKWWNNLGKRMLSKAEDPSQAWFSWGARSRYRVAQNINMPLMQLNTLLDQIDLEEKSNTKDIKLQMEQMQAARRIIKKIKKSVRDEKSTNQVSNYIWQQTNSFYDGLLNQLDGISNKEVDDKANGVAQQILSEVESQFKGSLDGIHLSKEKLGEYRGFIGQFAPQFLREFDESTSVFNFVGEKLGFTMPGAKKDNGYLKTQKNGNQTLTFLRRIELNKLKDFALRYFDSESLECKLMELVFKVMLSDDTERDMQGFAQKFIKYSEGYNKNPNDFNERFGIKLSDIKKVEYCELFEKAMIGFFKNLQNQGELQNKFCETFIMFPYDSLSLSDNTQSYRLKKLANKEEGIEDNKRSAYSSYTTSIQTVFNTLFNKATKDGFEEAIPTIHVRHNGQTKATLKDICEVVDTLTLDPEIYSTILSQAQAYLSSDKYDGTENHYAEIIMALAKYSMTFNMEEQALQHLSQYAKKRMSYLLGELDATNNIDRWCFDPLTHPDSEVSGCKYSSQDLQLFEFLSDKNTLVDLQASIQEKIGTEESVNDDYVKENFYPLKNVIEKYGSKQQKKQILFLEFRYLLEDGQKAGIGSGFLNKVNNYLSKYYLDVDEKVGQMRAETPAAIDEIHRMLNKKYLCLNTHFSEVIQGIASQAGDETRVLTEGEKGDVKFICSEFKAFYELAIKVGNPQDIEKWHVLAMRLLLDANKASLTDGFIKRIKGFPPPYNQVNSEEVQTALVAEIKTHIETSSYDEEPQVAHWQKKKGLQAQATKIKDKIRALELELDEINQSELAVFVDFSVSEKILLSKVAEAQGLQRELTALKTQQAEISTSIMKVDDWLKAHPTASQSRDIHTQNRRSQFENWSASAQLMADELANFDPDVSRFCRLNWFKELIHKPNLYAQDAAFSEQSDQSVTRRVTESIVQKVKACTAGDTTGLYNYEKLCEIFGRPQTDSKGKDKGMEDIYQALEIYLANGAHLRRDYAELNQFLHKFFSAKFRKEHPHKLGDSNFVENQYSVEALTSIDVKDDALPNVFIAIRSAIETNNKDGLSQKLQFLQNTYGEETRSYDPAKYLWAINRLKDIAIDMAKNAEKHTEALKFLEQNINEKIIKASKVSKEAMNDLLKFQKQRSTAVEDGRITKEQSEEAYEAKVAELEYKARYFSEASAYFRLPEELTESIKADIKAFIGWIEASEGTELNLTSPFGFSLANAGASATQTHINDVSHEEVFIKRIEAIIKTLSNNDKQVLDQSIESLKNSADSVPKAFLLSILKSFKEVKATSKFSDGLRSRIEGFLLFCREYPTLTDANWHCIKNKVERFADVNAKINLSSLQQLLEWKNQVGANNIMAMMPNYVIRNILQVVRSLSPQEKESYAELVKWVEEECETKISKRDSDLREAFKKLEEEHVFSKFNVFRFYSEDDNVWDVTKIVECLKKFNSEEFSLQLALMPNKLIQAFMEQPELLSDLSGQKRGVLLEFYNKRTPSDMDVLIKFIRYKHYYTFTNFHSGDRLKEQWLSLLEKEEFRQFHSYTKAGLQALIAGKIPSAEDINKLKVHSAIQKLSAIISKIKLDGQGENIKELYESFKNHNINAYINSVIDYFDLLHKAREGSYDKSVAEEFKSLLQKALNNFSAVIKKELVVSSDNFYFPVKIYSSYKTLLDEFFDESHTFEGDSFKNLCDEKFSEFKSYVNAEVRALIYVSDSDFKKGLGVIKKYSKFISVFASESQKNDFEKFIVDKLLKPYLKCKQPPGRDIDIHTFSEFEKIRKIVLATNNEMVNATLKRLEKNEQDTSFDLLSSEGSLGISTDNDEALNLSTISGAADPDATSASTTSTFVYAPSKHIISEDITAYRGHYIELMLRDNAVKSESHQEFVERYGDDAQIQRARLIRLSNAYLTSKTKVLCDAPINHVAASASTPITRRRASLSSLNSSSDSETDTQQLLDRIPLGSYRKMLEVEVVLYHALEVTKEIDTREKEIQNLINALSAQQAEQSQTEKSISAEIDALRTVMGEKIAILKQKREELADIKNKQNQLAERAHELAGNELSAAVEDQTRLDQAAQSKNSEIEALEQAIQKFSDKFEGLNNQLEHASPNPNTQKAVAKQREVIQEHDRAKKQLGGIRKIKSELSTVLDEYTSAIQRKAELELKSEGELAYAAQEHQAIDESLKSMESKDAYLGELKHFKRELDDKIKLYQQQTVRRGKTNPQEIRACLLQIINKLKKRNFTDEFSTDSIAALGKIIPEEGSADINQHFIFNITHSLVYQALAEDNLDKLLETNNHARRELEEFKKAQDASSLLKNAEFVKDLEKLNQECSRHEAKLDPLRADLKKAISSKDSFGFSKLVQYGRADILLEFYNEIKKHIDLLMSSSNFDSKLFAELNQLHNDFCKPYSLLRNLELSLADFEQLESGCATKAISQTTAPEDNTNKDHAKNMQHATLIELIETLKEKIKSIRSGKAVIEITAHDINLFLSKAIKFSWEVAKAFDLPYQTNAGFINIDDRDDEVKLALTVIHAQCRMFIFTDLKTLERALKTVAIYGTNEQREEVFKIAELVMINELLNTQTSHNGSKDSLQLFSQIGFISQASSALYQALNPSPTTTNGVFANRATPDQSSVVTDIQKNAYKDFIFKEIDLQKSRLLESENIKKVLEAIRIEVAISDGFGPSVDSNKKASALVTFWDTLPHIFKSIEEAFRSRKALTVLPKFLKLFKMLNEVQLDVNNTQSLIDFERHFKHFLGENFKDVAFKYHLVSEVESAKQDSNVKGKDELCKALDKIVSESPANLEVLKSKLTAIINENEGGRSAAAKVLSKTADSTKRLEKILTNLEQCLPSLPEAQYRMAYSHV